MYDLDLKLVGVFILKKLPPTHFLSSQSLEFLKTSLPITYVVLLGYTHYERISLSQFSQESTQVVVVHQRGLFWTHPSLPKLYTKAWIPGWFPFSFHS